MKKLALSAGLLLILGLAAVPMVGNLAPATAAEMSSGPAMGANLGAFDIKDTTGPWKGDPKVCYR